MTDDCLAMDNRSAATRVVETLRSAGHQAYFVGGCVRDMLLGLARIDEHDVATSARPGQIRSLFRRTKLVGAKFGVVLVKTGGHWIEVASFRTDLSYSDGRHPDKIAYATIDEDARRRDFTINGMYYDPFKDQVIDLVGGRDDLRARIIRAIGDPQRRFTEDHLRMLRAVRFAAQLDFKIDPPTSEAIAANAEHIKQITPERIHEEMKKLLTSAHRTVGIRYADQLGLLRYMIPELHALHGCPGISFATDFNVTPDSRDAFEHTLAALDRLDKDCRFEPALACLLHLVGLSRGEPLPFPKGVRERVGGAELHNSARLASRICRRLNCSNQQRLETVWFVQFLPLLGKGGELTLAELKRIIMYGRFQPLRMLYRARVQAGLEPEENLQAIDDLAGRFDQADLKVAPLITGTELAERLHLPPGPEYQEILDKVYDTQLNEQITTRQEALELARRLAEEMKLPLQNNGGST